jgi:hypothetical protein
MDHLSVDLPVPVKPAEGHHLTRIELHITLDLYPQATRSCNLYQISIYHSPAFQSDPLALPIFWLAGKAQIINILSYQRLVGEHCKDADPKQEGYHKPEVLKAKRCGPDRTSHCKCHAHQRYANRYITDDVLGPKPVQAVSVKGERI